MPVTCLGARGSRKVCCVARAGATAAAAPVRARFRVLSAAGRCALCGRPLHGRKGVSPAAACWLPAAAIAFACSTAAFTRPQTIILFRNRPLPGRPALPSVSFSSTTYLSLDCRA
jgi:hypothetical protein